MRNKVFLIPTITILSLIFVFGIYTYNTKSFAYWSIEIPSDFKKIYCTSIIGFHGDGWRYTVYKTKNNTHLAFIKGFKNYSDETIEELILNNLRELNADVAYYPPIDKPYLWWVTSGEKYYDNQLIIIYSPNTNYYYFLETYL